MTDETDDIDPSRPRPGTPRPATHGRKLPFALDPRATNLTGPLARPPRHSAAPRVAPSRISENSPRPLTASDISTLVSEAIVTHLPSIMAGMHHPHSHASPTATNTTQPPPVSGPPRPYMSALVC